MTKVAAFFCVLLFGTFVHQKSGAGNFVTGTRVEWMDPMVVAGLQEQNPRPIVVDVYTSWCYYCKLMDNTTWRNDSVVSYLKNNFYTIKLDAEDKNPQTWNGKSYAYQPKYKVNMLAVELLRGNMVYPSTVVIPARGEWQVIPGALKPAEIELVLKYYGSGSNEHMDFDEFRKTFRGEWK
jgi:thioredoxin-related protein